MLRLLVMGIVSAFLAFGCGGGEYSEKIPIGEGGASLSPGSGEQNRNVVVTGRIVLPRLNKPGLQAFPAVLRAVSEWSNSTVQLLDPWGNILATTSADVNGNFSLTAPPGKNYFLRATLGDMVLKSIIEDASVEVRDVQVGVSSSAIVKVLGVFLKNPNVGDPGVDISGALAGINVAETVSEIRLNGDIDELVNALILDIAGNLSHNQGRSHSDGDEGAGVVIAQRIASNIAFVDIVGPSVFSAVPSPGETGVDIFATVSVKFTEAVMATDLHQASFRVSSVGAVISGSLTGNGRNWTFSPSSPLSPFTSYNAIIKGSVTDIAGNSMGLDYTWSFMTGGNTEPQQSVQVSAGTDHSLLLKSNGSLWAWGRNFSGTANGGVSLSRPLPEKIWAAQVLPGVYWKEISVRGYHNFAIKTDGTLWSWGANDFGQLGDGSYKEAEVPAKVLGGDWKHVSAGRYHVMGIKGDGTLWSWGSNSAGQFGDGGRENSNSPVQTGVENDWEQVAPGSRHTVAIKTDGTLWSWGRDIGTGDGGEDRVDPVRVGTGSDWLKAAASGTFSVALRMDGTLWSWGSYSSGELGVGNNQIRAVPLQIGVGGDWKDVTTGADWWDSQGRVLAIKTDGTLWSWGANAFGQLGNGSVLGSPVPVQVGLNGEWSVLGAGDTHTIALRNDGTLWSWGANSYGALGDGMVASKLNPTFLGPEKNWTDIDAGWGYTIATKVDQSIWGWGDNNSGQLGSGTYQNEQEPVHLTPGSFWAQVSTGFSHALSVGANGTLWSWGLNDFGQLGNTGLVSRGSPGQVGVNFDWMEVSAGANYTVALKTDGTLWSWGGNTSGQLGDGSGVVDRNLPSQLGTDIWAQVSTGKYHTAAIRVDGTLWAWGSNEHGQLGNDTEEDLKIPGQAGVGNNWLEVAAGSEYTVALRGDGTLWSWGENVFGQLGDGTNIDRRTPVQVGLSADWKHIASGGEHSLALKTDGTLWTWGNNDYGQLGDGTRIDRNLPVATGGAGWIRVAGGRDHSLGLKADGGLWVWGSNNFGQLGDGTAWRVSPKQFAHL